MMTTREIKSKPSGELRKDKYFSIALALLRLRLSLPNAILLFFALGARGTRIDYVMVGIYLSINLAALLAPMVRFIATRPLRHVFFTFDLVVTGWVLICTGGFSSPLFPFLFIPLIILVMRCRYLEIIGWCGFIGIVLCTGEILGQKTWSWLPTLIKTGYFFLAGLVGVYLARRTPVLADQLFFERWQSDLQRLNHFSQELTGRSELDEIFTHTIAVVRQRNPFLQAAMMIFDDEEVLKIYASAGWEEEWLDQYRWNPLTRNSLTLAPILVFKKYLLCPDIKKHSELMKIFEGIPFQALFAFPLLIKGEVIGALVLTSPSVLKLSEQEAHLFAGIAGQAGIAIQNVLSLKQEKKKANIDGLTGLYNRRFFNEQIDVLVTKSLDEGSNLSLILLDVDNFKLVNDTFGHQVGDRLLKAITAKITENVRERDIVARYGGEEFAVLLKDSKTETARQIAERIRRAVEMIPQDVSGLQASISAGVATLPENAQDRNGLIEYADRGLYHAKRNGKNKVCCGVEEKRLNSP